MLPSGDGPDRRQTIKQAFKIYYGVLRCNGQDVRQNPRAGHAADAVYLGVGGF